MISQCHIWLDIVDSIIFPVQRGKLTNFDFAKETIERPPSMLIITYKRETNNASKTHRSIIFSVDPEKASTTPPQ